MSVGNSDIALAIIDFLRNSKGEVAEDFVESLDVAIDCIADAFEVDKDSDKEVLKSKFNGQSLAELIKSGGSAEKIAVNIPVEDTESKAKGEALKLEGNRAMARKDFNEAISKYTEALKIIPSNAVYLSNRAAAYSSNKQHDLAAKDAEEAIKSDPSYAKAYSRLGLLKFALGDAKAAMEAYKKGIEAEGDSPSESMKKGFETAKSRVQSDLETSLGSSNSSTETPSARDTPAASLNPGAGGMPDLSSMFGGAGGGMADIFNNPQIMQAAQQMMSNPLALQNLMSNPAVLQMASQFGLGGGAPGASAGAPAGGEGSAPSGGESGQPDLSELLNNPMLANLANQFLGGGRNPGSGN